MWDDMLKGWFIVVVLLGVALFILFGVTGCAEFHSKIDIVGYGSPDISETESRGADGTDLIIKKRGQ